MLGVYTPCGRLIGHYPTPGAASRVALEAGEGARVTSAQGGYVVRDGALRLATCRQEPTGRAWRHVDDEDGVTYRMEVMAAL